MNIEVPPFLFYAVGAMLMVFGSLRAFHLGWRQRRDDGLGASVAEGDDPEAHQREVERAGRRARDARRHLIFGLVWLAMGLFLVISTLLNTRG